MTASSITPNTVVAVSQRVDHISNRNEDRDALDQRMVQWLLQAGLLPVGVPNSLVTLGGNKNMTIWLNTMNPKAIVLSGGNNIGEYPSRDLTETGLLEYAEANQLPVLGICRGMQMMAHHSGVGLISVADHAETRHELRLKDHLEGIYPNEVNSFHDWKLAECPVNYEAFAFALDGTIEAIRHKSMPWEGWMWHPEREVALNKMDLNRVQRLMVKGPF